MSLHNSKNKNDRGALTIVPVFTLLFIVNALGLYEVGKTLDPASTLNISTMIHRLLVVFFYGLFVLLYLKRRAAILTERSLVVKTIAVVTTFIPFAIPLVSSPINDPGIIFFANLVTIFGMSIALYSLGALGASISIIPQARALVRTGPYKIVRHPVYLGELIAILGIVLARFSWPALVIFVLLTVLQIFRAFQEERILSGVFPEYDSYRLKSARFIPGIY
jgi:protein-S-isoprenylcysteine O-methyltransferase Ste14